MNDEREYPGDASEGGTGDENLPVRADGPGESADDGATDDAGRHGGADGGGPADGERNGPPWEDREAHGFLVAFARTLEESALKPNEFFARMRLTGNLLDALLYGTGIIVITAFVELVWSAILAPLPFFFLGEIGGVTFPEVAAMAAYSWVRILIMPFFMVAVFFVLAGLFHFALTLLGSTPRPFETTLRVTCYSAAPLLLTIVPFCGEWIGRVWMIVLLVIGLMHCQRASTMSAIVAVIFPVLLLVGCCSLLIAIPIALSNL